ncbi:type I DNA topoisomerase [Oceanivirga miroungae]|uniref:DNA topoisomerase 1 n=1 Tax=Oceanivirga miroungae TaxID=1130046 RepID=A0A6I8MER8_9FUSO|nr:type I DNA topoisomerase [Oceanivirga miroungae]VWL85729.1 DNA topoisomerase I [Oceanivirga miroungae]
MKKNLVIVESPSKAKTIEKILGKSYKVKASFGHLVDLPKTSLGIDIENGFKPKYTTIKGKGPILAELKKEAKKSDVIYLASDLDREGEAIAWHISNAIKENEKIRRIVFNEITATAIKKAIKEPRDIDINLVDSQQARRLLDRLVGYEISPLLWRTVNKNASAGRVQSVSLKIICDLEDEIKNFTPEEYREFSVLLKNGIELKLSKVDNKKVDKIFDKNFNVDLDKYLLATSVEIKNKSQRPPMVFKTSTLQQLASSYLGFSASKTMRIAQQLYEGLDIAGVTKGLITYMRTDSVRVSGEAMKEAKEYIENNYGKEYVGKYVFNNKKGSQDAHEGIRPSYLELEPDKIAGYLSRDQYKLYTLIWKRFICSQFADMKYEQLQITANDKNLEFSGTVNKVVFDGYYKYQKDEEDIKTSDLPDIKKDDKLEIEKLNVKDGITKAPSRFTEASLVKKLESLGIGRPSTYANIIDTLVNKEYVTKEDKKLVPSILGYEVKNELVSNFSNIMNTEFTSEMESDLDEIADGKKTYINVLEKYYENIENDVNKYKKEIDKLKDRIILSDVLDKNGKAMILKSGRFGKYLISTTNEDEKLSLKAVEVSNDEINAGKVFVKDKLEKVLKEKNGHKTDYTENGVEFLLKKGRFGEYLESKNYETDNIRKSLSASIRNLLKKGEVKIIDDKYILKDLIEKEIKSDSALLKAIGKCEKCSSDFTIKKGRYGKFFACSNYPNCNNIKNIKKGKK